MPTALFFSKCNVFPAMRAVHPWLKHALHALHGARVESKGLDQEQKVSLQKAEEKLKEATKTAKFGKLKNVGVTGFIPLRLTTR